MKWLLVLLSCSLVLCFSTSLASANPAGRVTLPAWWVRAALCVHRYEGSWHDSGAPYYGGMQFDHHTWLANGGGRFSTYPHYATPHEQLLVAYWTWRKRGWWPWPNTARRCGLL